MPTELLPCASRIDVYDALIDSEPGTSDFQVAQVEAARLCAGCVRQCAERITPDASPWTVADFNATQWTPKRAPRAPRRTRPEQRQHKYVQPAAWARMVAAMAGQGLAPAVIAEALRVDESTVTELLALAMSDRAA